MGVRAKGWRWPALATVLAAVACGGGESAETAAEDAARQPALAAIQANPCDLTLTDRDAASYMEAPDSMLALVLTGTTDLESEVNDCQRLVMSLGATGAYGPLVGLFPVDATLALGRAEFATAWPAVTIYNWGSAGGTYQDSYPDLGITPGAHCLWLRNATDSETGWQAAIAADVTCTDRAPAPAETDFSYPVFERVYPGAEAADYPRTARWKWDQNGQKQFIGVKCGNAWCGVMAAGASAPRTAAIPQPLPDEDIARFDVPGWSDAQHLPIEDQAAGGVRPGPWGSVVPHPGIRMEDTDWTEGLLAAAIRVEGSARDPGFSSYVERFFLGTESGFARADVLLRFPPLNPAEAWYQQVGEIERASDLTYISALSHAASGAVRWRWQEGQAALWIFCRAGSCYVEGT